MSEHTWVLEHLETYVTGGLDDAETSRLERHIVDCPPCTDALSGVQGVDRALATLFAPVLPAADVEDRVIQSLRLQRRPGVPRFVKWGMAAAAVILVGVTGAGMSAFAMKDGLRFPGMERSDAEMSAVGQLSDRTVVVTGLPDAIGAYQSPRSQGWGDYRVDGASQAPVSQAANPQAWGESSPPSADELAQNLRQQVDLYMVDGDDRLARESKGWYADPAKVDNLGNLAKSRETPTAESANQPADSTYGFALGGAGGGMGRAGALGGTGGGGGSGFGGGGLGAPGGGPGAPMAAGGSVPARGLALQAFGTVAAQPTSPATVNTVTITNGAVTTNLTDGTSATLLYAELNKALETDKKLSKDVSDQIYMYYRNDSGKIPPTAAPVAVSPDGKNLAAFSPPVAVPSDAAPTAPATGVPDGGAIAAGGIAVAQNKPEAGKPATTTPPQIAPAMPRKIIIRSGTIEFEIESFDSAVATVTKLVMGYQGGYVDTVNSEKLANGKVRGTVVVRVPPDHLDGLVLDLRKELGKGGELKGQKIGSEDITKMYTDMESRLKAARAMEGRLLEMIKTGKGEIKDLLNAEKELGVWRTKIEELEGEIKYYGNLAALSRLTITLAEKEIRAPSAIVETERIQMGIEAEDVDKTQRDALTAVADAKGRVTKSELKQHAAGQFNAIIHFEVAPDAAGPLRDRLKQLGNVARLEIDRATQAEGGTGKPQDAKVKRADTQFQVSIYNLTSVLPRETVVLHLACTDTEASYKAILARAQKATARILNSNLNQLRPEQTTGTVAFEVKAADADAVLKDLKDQGEVLRQQVAENPDQQATTKSKRGFVVTLLAHSLVQPREMQTMTLVTRDVPAGYKAVQDAVAKAKGLVRKAQLNEQDKQKISADLEFDYQRTEEATIAAALSAAGEVHNRNVQRAQEADNTSDSKIRVTIRMLNVANIPPRETTVLALEVKDVDTVANAFNSLVTESKGTQTSSQQTYERNGRFTRVLEYDVPLVAASGLVEKFKSAGIVRVQQSGRNPQVPDGELARAHLSVTLSNETPIVPTDDGFSKQFRGGLSYSLKALALSGSWLIFGLCVLLPWALVTWGLVYVGRSIYRRMRGTVPATTAS
jgi:anti-sigma factor RsiW